MIHHTTQAHYEKYAALNKKYSVKVPITSSLCRAVPVFPRPVVVDIPLALATLRELYKKDVHLNNISLEKFDRVANGMLFRESLSLAEKVCMLKHSILYDVLELTPEYTDT